MALVNKRSNFQIWCDVVFAIFLREIRSKFNDKLGISWAVINPLIFIFLLSFARSLMGGEITHTMPTLVFMIYGMLLVRMFLSTFEHASMAIKSNKSLFAFRQVQPISTVVAVAFLELLSIAFVILVIFIIIYMIRVDATIDDPLTIFVCILQVWIFAISCGLLFGIGSAFFQEINKLKVFLQRPMFFLSGIFFSLQDIPKEYWKYLDWNPILHAVEISRDAAYPSFNAQGVSLSYLFLVTLFMASFALFCYQVTWKKVLS